MESCGNPHDLYFVHGNNRVSCFGIRCHYETCCSVKWKRCKDFVIYVRNLAYLNRMIQCWAKVFAPRPPFFFFIVVILRCFRSKTLFNIRQRKSIYLGAGGQKPNAPRFTVRRPGPEAIKTITLPSPCLLLCSFYEMLC